MPSAATSEPWLCRVGQEGERTEGQAAQHLGDEEHCVQPEREPEDPARPRRRGDAVRVRVIVGGHPATVPGTTPASAGVPTDAGETARRAVDQ
jgi:hypothetical protein